MKVIYFASIRQQIGKSEEIVIIEENCSIRDLIDKLVKKGENYKIALLNVRKSHGVPVQTGEDRVILKVRFINHSYEEVRGKLIEHL